MVSQKFVKAIFCIGELVEHVESGKIVKIEYYTHDRAICVEFNGEFNIKNCRWLYSLKKLRKLSSQERESLKVLYGK